MGANELFKKDGTSAGFWVCGKCRYVHDSEQAAVDCCEPRVCKKCGEKREKYTDLCGKCWSEKRSLDAAIKLAERLEKAEDVTETYTGPVYCETYTGGGWGDGYYSDMEDLLEYLSCEQDEWPEWCFACTPNVRVLDPDDAIQRICDDGYEDMGEDLMASEELKAACQKWSEENKARLTVWHTDYKRKIRVPQKAEQS